MKTASAEEVRAEFDAYLKATDKGPVVVTRNAKPVAVLLSVKDPEEIERMAMSQSKKLRKILQKSQAQIAKGRGIPEQEFWRQVERMRKRQNP
jgi:prevent-host-death family protein